MSLGLAALALIQPWVSALHPGWLHHLKISVLGDVILWGCLGAAFLSALVGVATVVVRKEALSYAALTIGCVVFLFNVLYAVREFAHGRQT